jgi:hypothetical protein
LFISVRFSNLFGYRLEVTNLYRHQCRIPGNQELGKPFDIDSAAIYESVEFSIFSFLNEEIFAITNGYSLL